MSGYYSVVHDPDGRLGHQLPLDREPHLQLATSVLAWTPQTVPPVADTALTVLELTGHARLLRDELADRIDRLPADCERRQLLTYTLGEAERRLSPAAMSPCGDLAHAQNRARLVQALYGSLDRLEAERPACGSCSHPRSGAQAHEARTLAKG
ncbi:MULTISPECIES: DUF6415 family natural product biosynthesis protein [unclassified Streptomyces]|uniref:DUF6415 family natural product biosynthesis protein n=1 Tax=unclassified Streptomyces TaxID=2593676 RepID=UPI003426A2B5